MQEGVLSIEDALGDLRDPRSRTPTHDLTEMLVAALCAILSGADSWVAIQTWAEAKLDWLRRYLPLVNGIASHDTFGSVASTQRRYHISSLPANPCRIAHAARTHWCIPKADFLRGVENNTHWVLDMAFGEDQCRVRVENAARNFAILRRITMNPLKRDTNTKAGLKIRGLKACANDQYRATQLGL